MKDLSYIWRAIVSSHRLIAATIVMQTALALVVVGNCVPVIVGTLQSAWSASGLTENSLGVVQVDNGPSGSAQFDPKGVLAALSQVSGVQSVSVMSSLPLQDRASTFNPYRTLDGNAIPRRVSAYVASPGSLGTLGVHLVSGRDFESAEYRPYDGSFPATPATIVSKSLADYLWPGEQPLGKQLIMSPSHLYTVVGVVNDVAETFPSTLHAPQLTALFAGEPGPNVNDTFAFRYTGADDATFRAIGKAMRDTVPVAVINGPRTYTQIRRDYLSKPVRVSMLFALICAVVVVTMGIGVGTLAGYWIAQRSESIAIRRALGATRRDIRRYFITEAGLLSGTGLVIGVGLTYLCNHYLGHIVEVRPPAVSLLLASAIFFLAFNLVAVAAPLRRAARAAPAEVFRLR
jgi:putative ABC transport system permease protein